MGIRYTGSNLWLLTTLALSVALVLAVLLLPPWSPVSMTSEEGDEPLTQAITQGPSGLERPPEPSPNPLNERVAKAPTLPLTSEPKEPVPPDAEALGQASDASQTSASGPVPTANSTPDVQDVRADIQLSSGLDGVGLAEPTNGSLDYDSLGIAELIVATEDANWKARWDAVNALGDLKDPRGIPALVERALRDDNPHPRWRSLWALSAVDREARDALPLLLRGLQDSDPVVVRNAAVALAFFGRPEARPELLHGLEDSDSWRRWEAVFSLRNVGDSDVVAALIALLSEETEPDARVRQESALTLGRIGGEAETPALLAALRSDPSPEVRWRAALALSQLADPSVVGELEQALSTEEDAQVREQIQIALASLRQGS